MKRILQRIWFWIPFGCICCVILSLLAFATEEVRQVPKLQNRLDALTNAVDPIQARATNGFYSLLHPESMDIPIIYTTNGFAIEWVGKIVTADDSDKYTPRGIGWLKDYELGLRSDGMVVWREKK